MLITAQNKFIHTSPRKLRLVAKAIRPLSVDDALLNLKHLSKRGALPLLKTLKQAVGNAVNNLNRAKDSLTIHTMSVDEGPTYKRFQPVSRGRGHSIYKRTSHIKVILESKEPVADKPVKAKVEAKKEATHGTKS